MIPDKVLRGVRLRVGCLILGDNSWYEKILDRLREKHPGIGEIETAQGARYKRFTPGLGTVEKAREFYRLIGTEDRFDPDLWRQPKAPTPAITDEYDWVSMECLHDKRGVAAIINIRPEFMGRTHLDEHWPDIGLWPMMMPAHPEVTPALMYGGA